MKHVPRFFIETQCAVGLKISLSSGQAHHALKVLRLNVGDMVTVFNETCGELSAKIFDKNGVIECIDVVREACPEYGPSIACAIISPNRMSMLLEKATEFGVKTIYPIITEYTQYRKFNTEKAKQIVINASEQCKRLSVPKIENAIYLNKFLENFNRNMLLYVADERLCGERIYEAIEENAIFLIGPEGGFSKNEFDYLCNQWFVKNIKLSDNILRAESAAFFCLSCWGCKFSSKKHFYYQ